jgi:hypothetical protein
MKPMYRITISLFILITFFSCVPPAEERSEGLAILIPTEQIGVIIPNENYFAHVYLLIGDELFPLGNGTNYVEQPINLEGNQESIVVENIPAGMYTLWLGIGIKREENDAFNVQYYYESDIFELIAGSTTHIDAAMIECPFEKALNVLGENINGVVMFPPTLYASGPKNLYSYSGVYNGPDFDVDVNFTEANFPDYSINSVSRGLDYTGVGTPGNIVFVNTTTGISKWDGSTFPDSNVSTNLETTDVLRSLAYPDGNNLSIYFQRNGGLGGVYQEADPPTDWVVVDYSEFLKDQLVLDFCVTDNLTSNAGYFATAIGALRVPQFVLENYTEGDEFNLMSQVNFFSIIDSGTGEEIPIVSLGYDAADQDLYMGTYEGLFYGAVPDGTTDAITPGTITLLGETAGKRIFMVLLNPAYRVYVSNTYLFLQDRGTSEVISLPFVAGLPGEISAIDWDGNVLIISGSLGLVTLDVDALFAGK